MNTTPRNLPRFLPTLTEVVHLSDLTRSSAAATPNSEKMVQSVMQQLDPVLEGRLREEAEAMVRTMVMEQLPTLRLRLRQELELVVRQAVSEAQELR